MLDAWHAFWSLDMRQIILILLAIDVLLFGAYPFIKSFFVRHHDDTDR